MKGYHLLKKQKIADTCFKPNNMDKVVDIEKLNEFNLLKEDVAKVGLQYQSADSEKRRLIHLIEFLKDPFDVCEFIIVLLFLNVSIEEMYQIICG